MIETTLNGKPSVKRDGSQKPPRFSVLHDKLPSELVGTDRWVGWRWERKQGSPKWTKPPVKVCSGIKCDVTEEANWCDFSTAFAAFEAEEVDGVGFSLGVLDDGRNICGIDIDDCRNRDTGEIDPAAWEIINKFDIYWEISPSGEGVKGLGIGRKEKHSGCTFILERGMKIEIFDVGRYFTATGHHLEGTETQLCDCGAEIVELLRTLNPVKEPRFASSLSDRELAIEALRNISADRAVDYHSWLSVGMALQAVSDDLLNDWNEWSRQSDNYSEGVCAQKWGSFKRDGLGIGSLIYWAKENGWIPPRRKRNRSDLGNGERFVDQHGDRVRHVGVWKKWLVWDGTRFKRDDTGAVNRLAKRTVRSIFKEAAAAAGDEDERKAIWKWANSSEKRERIAAMISLASTENPIAIAHDTLDSDPWLLNCENGTIDLKTGELRPHDPGDLITKSTLVEFPTPPGVDAPLWGKFLQTTFDGNQSLIDLVQRLFGASLVGKQIEHVLAILYGTGANGKSVFTSTVQGALGDYAMTAPPGLLMAKRFDQHPTEVADLFGMRLVVINETKDGQRLDEGLVKSITGGDKIRARRMRENFWQFSPSHLPIIATNHRPVVRGNDYGIWRRLRLIPFNVTITPERQDKRLTEKLRAELPGILRWLVEGCLEWQRGGLREPPVVLAATESYRVESDTITTWLDECCEMHPDADRKAGEAYHAYSDWCKDNNEIPLSNRRFGEKIQERFTRLPRRRDGYYYRGFRRLGQSCEPSE